MEFLTNRKQRVMVNIHHGQVLKQTFLKGSFQELLFFLLYKNNMIENLDSHPKLFTALLFIADNVAQSSSQWSSDLTKIND